MPQPRYVAISDREKRERNWSILFPDFPEIASVRRGMTRSGFPAEGERRMLIEGADKAA